MPGGSDGGATAATWPDGFEGGTTGVPAQAAPTARTHPSPIAARARAWTKTGFRKEIIPPCIGGFRAALSRISQRFRSGSHLGKLHFAS
jgi:hypothetical protein